MFEHKFGIQPICQSPHELKAKPPIRRRLEIFRKPTPSSVTSTMNDPSLLVSQRRLTFTTKPDGCAYLLAFVSNSAVISPA